MADLDDGRVLFAALHKFVVCKFRIFILIHILEDLVYALEYNVSGMRARWESACLVRGVLIYRQLDHLSCHLVNGLDDLKHLVIGNCSVSVYIIQLEGNWKKPNAIKSGLCGTDEDGENEHLSFSSSFPRLVTLRAAMNSLNSMFPSLLASKTLKTWSANSAGSPNGKNCLYILANSGLSRWPEGQSFLKPLCHCWISFLSTAEIT
jgi:hypothetical protein